MKQLCTQVTNGPTIRSLPTELAYSLQLSAGQEVFKQIFYYLQVQVFKQKKFSDQVRVDSVVARFHNLTFHLWAATPGRLLTGLGQGLEEPQSENCC